jgi:protein-S-isoprenylcysteine O-methyltransferase Ste14
MITGVALVLGGEVALFRSPPLLILLAMFLAVNAIYFPLIEEPALSRRFGKDYDVYRAHVPRWLPRLRPWQP